MLGQSRKRRYATGKHGHASQTKRTQRQNRALRLEALEERALLAVDLLDQRISVDIGQAGTARDGQTVTFEYQINATEATTATLEASLVSPQGVVIGDLNATHQQTVALTAGTQWYQRQFTINLPPGASTNESYTVVWTVHSGTSVDSATSSTALTVLTPRETRVPVLMYHYVQPQASGDYTITPEALRSQLLALKAYGYTPVTMQDVMDYRAGYSSPADPANKPVLVTFDDGDLSFLTYALPVLQEVGVKATVFALPGFVDTAPASGSVSWEQLATLRDSGLVDIQSHSMSHPALSTLDASQLAAELVNSKQELESHLGTTVHFIAWPYGDYNDTVGQAAWQAGYVAGLTAWGGTEANSFNKWFLTRVYIGPNVSVNSYPDPSQFLFSVIGDASVAVPQISLGQLQYLDASGNPLNANQLAAGQAVRVRVTATNTGSTAVVVAGLQLDSDADHNNGVAYDSSTASPSQDLQISLAAGQQQTLEWTWTSPAAAPLGQYYASVRFEDQHQVLGVADSGWQTAFAVTAAPPINHAPSFIAGANQTVLANAGAQTVTGWATAISAGPADESGQSLTFLVTGNTNSGLFAASPSIAANGTLTYTPAANANGTAIISVALQDNGGTAGGGQDTSAVQTFTITVETPVVAATTVLVTSDRPSGSVYGQGVTFTATVIANSGSGVPTGSVQFVIDNANFGSPVAVASGAASIVASSLATGSHSVRAIYTSNDPDHFLSSQTAASLTATVSKASATTTLQSSLPGGTVYGQAVTFTAAVSAQAPSLAVPTGQVRFLDNGNLLGRASLVNGVASFTTGSSLLNRGTRTITAVYEGTENWNQATSPALSQAVQTALVQPDALDPTKSTLAVGGTSQSDAIYVTYNSLTNQVMILVSGGTSYTANYNVANLAHLALYGAAGIDLLYVATNVPVPSLLFGGDGDDTLSSGSAGSVMVGGQGIDTLYGWTGRDVLIGGQGNDALQGLGNQDLFIGGATDYDQDLAALERVMAEWRRTDVQLSQRVAHLRDGSAGGLNGTVRLNPTTVHDDAAVDYLLGGVDPEWYFTTRSSASVRDVDSFLTLNDLVTYYS